MIRCIDRYLDPDSTRRRDLGTTCSYYRVPYDPALAHDSAHDALAAARLAWRLAKREPARVGLIDPDVLHSHQAGWSREQELAYAENLDLLIGHRIHRDGDSDGVARLRARAAEARARASAGS